MGKITIDFESEVFDNAMIESMLYSRANLLEDLKRPGGVFEMDPEEDRKQIREMILALEKVIGWYSIPGTFLFDEIPE
jgi:hypothetical protein